jgi:hypothetical protein
MRNHYEHGSGRESGNHGRADEEQRGRGVAKVKHRPVPLIDLRLTGPSPRVRELTGLWVDTGCVHRRGASSPLRVAADIGRAGGGTGPQGHHPVHLPQPANLGQLLR